MYKNTLKVMSSSLISLVLFLGLVPHIHASALVTEFNVPSSNSGTSGITYYGPDGDLWFTERQTNKIGKMTPAGVFTEYNIPTTGADPLSITSGPDGNLWFTENGANKIGKITPTGTITEYAIPSANSLLASITAGPDGNLWFVETNNDKIGKITPTGTITEYAIPVSLYAASPIGIASGADGKIWFTQVNANKIGSVTTSGVFAEYDIPTASSFPWDIAAGGDGNYWFLEGSGSTNGKVARITPAGVITEFPLLHPASNPWRIAAGPGGSLWFSESSALGLIGQINPNGTITEYNVPSTNAGAYDLVEDGDHNMWFAESATDKIAKISGFSYPTAPAIINHSSTVSTGSSVIVDVLTGVAGNPDANTLQIVSGPLHGTAVDPPNTITYTPNKGYIGPDSLTYRVCSTDNPLLCTQAVLSFNVVVGIPNTGLGGSATNQYQNIYDIFAVFSLALFMKLVLVKNSKIRRAP